MVNEEQKKEKPKREKPKESKNELRVGSRDNVYSLVSRLEEKVGGGATEVRLMAMGRAIAKIADVIELAKRKPFYSIEPLIPKYETIEKESEEEGKPPYKISSMEQPIKITRK